MNSSHLPVLRASHLLSARLRADSRARPWLRMRPRSGVRHRPMPDLAETRSCYCLAARRAARAITRHFDKHLRPYGLRSTQFSVLSALAQLGATPISELAETLGLERTTLTRNAALLERNGWVATARSDDARERRLQLTGAGRQTLEVALPAWHSAQAIVDEWPGVRTGLAPWSLS